MRGGDLCGWLLLTGFLNHNDILNLLFKLVVELQTDAVDDLAALLLHSGYDLADFIYDAVALFHHVWLFLAALVVQHLQLILKVVAVETVDLSVGAFLPLCVLLRELLGHFHLFHQSLFNRTHVLYDLVECALLGGFQQIG